MANPVNNPVGVLVNPPNLATSPAESEVTNINPSAVVASGAGAAPTNASEPASVADACQTYTTENAPLVDGLESVLEVPAPGASVRLYKVGGSRLQAIPMLSALLVKYPTLTGDFTADDIDADMADADACTSLNQDLAALTARVTYTQRIKVDSAWTRSSTVYAAAVKKAAKDSDVARDVAPIQALFATGPRADKSAVTALVATQAASKATAKAGNLQQKATALTAAANALQHGTGDATITQPAPSAPAPSTTALAATPGTPGSTKIR